MKKTKVLITARLGDWHIGVDGGGVWDTGRTPEEAIENFRKNAKAHDLPVNLEIRYAKDSFTQRARRGEVSVHDEDRIREAQQVHLMVGRMVYGI